jgi:hypothetical protein
VLNGILLCEAKRLPPLKEVTMTDEKKPTRKHKHLRVPVLPDEEQQIKRQACAAGLAVAAYLRSVGLGYEICGVLDYQRVDQLAKVNADLGRGGGLLKLWLTNDERLRRFSPEQIRNVLSKIEANQDELRKIIKKVISS